VGGEAVVKLHTIIHIETPTIGAEMVYHRLVGVTHCNSLVGSVPRKGCRREEKLYNGVQIFIQRVENKNRPQDSSYYP
jgi:hypothetical protein